MSHITIVDYGGHSFTYWLARQLKEQGRSVRYLVNGSLEAPNLSSLDTWQKTDPYLVEVVRCKAYGKLNLRERFSGELRWVIQCIKTLRRNPPSAVVATCLPLSVAVPIQMWCKRRRIPFVYWLQDLQGRAIQGLLGNKLGVLGMFAAKIAQQIETYSLVFSEFVIAISPDHVSCLPSAVVAQKKVAVLENWGNVLDISVRERETEWSRANGIGSSLNIIYAGSLGLKHDTNMFLVLARALKHRPNVRVVIISSGQALDNLRKNAMACELDNLLCIPFQESSLVPDILAAGTVLIAPLDASAGSFCVPSKVLSYLCAGRPVVVSLSVENRAAQMIREARAGNVVEPGDTIGFIEAVKSYLDDPLLSAETGRRARAYAERTFSLEVVVTRFCEILGKANVSIPNVGSNDSLCSSGSKVRAATNSN